MKRTYHPHRRWERVIKSLALAVAVAGVTLLVPGGGPAQAGSPTLEAIQGLPQAWDKTLPANDPGGACPSNSSRFTCVMGNASVRDNETGLVWEQSPVTTAHSWNPARFECTGRTTGGRKGWRLPSVHELASLMDPNNPSGNPNLPPGHPFSAVQSSNYWSASNDADDPAGAWFVTFLVGAVETEQKTATFFVWCVRGGMNAGKY